MQDTELKKQQFAALVMDLYDYLYSSTGLTGQQIKDVKRMIGFVDEDVLSRCVKGPRKLEA